MSAKLQGIRLSDELRGLVDLAGRRLNPAARALLILGAHAAGQGVGHLESTIHVLIDAGELAPGTVAALRHLLPGGDSATDSAPDSNRAISPGLLGDDHLLRSLIVDPLAGVGIEV